MNYRSYFFYDIQGGSKFNNSTCGNHAAVPRHAKLFWPEPEMASFGLRQTAGLQLWRELDRHRFDSKGRNQLIFIRQFSNPMKVASGRSLTAAWEISRRPLGPATQRLFRREESGCPTQAYTDSVGLQKLQRKIIEISPSALSNTCGKNFDSARKNEQNPNKLSPLSGQITEW